MKFLRPILVVISVLALDQTLKFWVKLHYTMQQNEAIAGHWFYFYFIENEGMAFGMTLGGEYGKLLLSVFRIAAVAGISYGLIKMVHRKAHPGFIICLSLILAGALGNILDSVFYGKIFSASTSSQVSQLFPPGGGYAGWLHGQVVDMLYFPIIDGYFPQWVPFCGGEYFVFFRPIFNVADASISVGVISIIIFQRRFFKSHKKKEAQSTEQPVVVEEGKADENNS